jgi:hypothetical protein
MRVLKIAIAGFEGVGRATAGLNGGAELTSAPYALVCHPSEKEMHV